MLHFNLYPNKMFAGCFASLAALICDNLLPLFITIVIFELMDFATGIMKSAVLAKRAGRRFAFESIKAWRTIYKMVFILIGVVLAEMLDATIAEETRLVYRLLLRYRVLELPGERGGHFRPSAFPLASQVYENKGGGIDRD